MVNSSEAVCVGELGQLPETFAFEKMSASDASTALPGKAPVALLDDLQEGRTVKLDRLRQEDYGFFLPRALARLVIDSLVDDESESRIRLINATTRVALGYYAGLQSAGRYGELKDLLTEHRLSHARLPFAQHDSISDPATAHTFSLDSAQRMQSKFGPNEPLLVVPVLTGGYIAALQTALYYQRARPDTEVAVHPVYYSRLKAGHEAPLVTRAEIDHLRSLALDRTVVIHDEDTSNISNGTMAKLVAFFSGVLDHQRVYGVVNRDNRDESIRKLTGAWWERCSEATKRRL